MIGEQRVTVRVHTTDDHVMVTAPLPGLEPGDISVSTHDREVPGGQASRPEGGARVEETACGTGRRGRRDRLTG